MTGLQFLEDAWEDQFFFSKYPEFVNGKDSVESQDLSFAEGGYGPEVITSETMRGAPIASVTGATLFLPEQVPEEQLEYLKQKFDIEIPETITFDNDNPESYTEAVNSLPDNSLQVMHPYPKFNDDVYTNDPENLAWLNNKKNLPEIAPNTPDQQVMSAEETINQELGEEVVVKKESGAAGDGVKITDESSELEGFLEPEEEALVQEKIEPDNNWGIQYFALDGEVYFVGHNTQATTEDGAFIGVTCDLTGNPPEGLSDFGEQSAQNVADTGYEGFIGFDVLEKDSELYAIDPNIRITASTPAFMMQEALKSNFGNYVNLCGLEVEADSYGEVVDKLESMGAAPYCSSGHVDGSYEVFAVTGGSTPEDANQKMQSIQEEIN